jgi:hypothetical protein
MSYTLGGTDATSFSINGNQLKMAQDVDIDTKSSYSISITVSNEWLLLSVTVMVVLRLVEAS